MGKLYANIKKYTLSGRAKTALLGEETVDAYHWIGGPAEKARNARVSAEKALKEAEADPSKGVIPMPDEEELERARRRRNARMRGGRESTMLANDGQGFGG